MENIKIKLVLGKIVNDYAHFRIDRKCAIEELINNLNPDEIYNIDDEDMIPDCYFAIKHLCEEGYETTMTEIKYFDECFRGIRKYNVDEKNEYIKDFFKSK